MMTIEIDKDCAGYTDNVFIIKNKYTGQKCDDRFGIHFNLIFCHLLSIINMLRAIKASAY